MGKLIDSPVDDGMDSAGASGGGSTAKLTINSPAEMVAQPPANYGATGGDCVYDGVDGLPKGDRGLVPQVTQEKGEPSKQSIDSPAGDIDKAP